MHFAHRRHALLGDPVYGGRLALPAGATDELIDALRSFRRQALHAARLKLAHPVTSQALDLEAAVPGDFEKLLDILQKDKACSQDG